MPERTNAQKILITYCRQRGYLKIKITGPANVLVTENNSQQRSLTINLFGDILDQETKKLIAVGNTPHDVFRTYDLPTQWKDVRPSIRKTLEQKKDPHAHLQKPIKKIIGPEL